MSPRHFLALIAAACLLLWNLNYAPVWNPDEGRYISASLEMIEPLDGTPPDWTVPHLNTIARLNKPPLVYWSAAALFKVFGVHVPVARLASAIAAVGVLALLFLLGRKMFNRQTGVLAAVTWATCVLPFTMGRMLSTDMQLAFAMTLALVGLYWALAPTVSTPPPKRWPGFLIAALGLGLALLSKGPVGLGLPLIIAFVWMLMVCGKATFRLPVIAGVLGAMAFAIAMATPWYLAVNRVEPQFISQFLLGENIGRLTGGKFYHNTKPFWFYIPVILIAALPWSAFLWPALRSLIGDFKARRATATPETQAAQARLFLWIWAVAVVGLFSLSSTKLITYILPALPPLALLIAQTFFHKPEDQAYARIMKRAAGVTAGVLLLLGILLPLLFLHPKLLADKIMTRADVLPFVAGLSVVLIMGAIALFLRRPAFKVLPLTGAALFMVLTGFMGRFALYEDPSPMIERLLPYLQPDGQVMQFKTFQPSVMYYTHRPSVIVDFANRSGLDEEEYENSGDFVDNHDAIKKALATGKQVFVLTRWKHLHWPTLPKMHLIAINNDYRLLSNQPAPAGYHYEHIAPRKRQRELSPACKALEPDC